jgi:cysteine desulfurase
MSIYLDNAATTPLDPEVFDAMKPFMLEDFGNPSSTHAHGRKARAAIESARKKIASLLNCTPGEIIFTSGGTEADNAILAGAIETWQIKNVISSPIEHHAVLHTLEHLQQRNVVRLHMVNLNEKGHVDYAHLESLLKANERPLVSLMHANNEIGNLLHMQRVSELSAEYGAYFHSDTVQAMGHYSYDLQQLRVHGITAAAHKFHGPKGAGFKFIRKDKKINPFVLGGSQERNMRGGTENVYGIIGLAKALEIAYRDMDSHRRHIESLKSRMIEKLRAAIPGVTFNGDSDNLEHSLYTVLSVSLPESDENNMLLFNLDLQGISASGGSACSSGVAAGSHVLSSLYPDSKRAAVRFSLSKYNSQEDIDYTVAKLATLIGVRQSV